MKLEIQNEDVGTMDISGSLAINTAENYPVPKTFGPDSSADQFHLKSIGKIIEQNEG